MKNKIMILIIGIFIIIGIGSIYSLTNNELKERISTGHFFQNQDDINLVNKWVFNHINIEEGINVSIKDLDSNTLEIEIINTNGGGYRFHSAICNLSKIDKIEKSEYNFNTEVWTNTGQIQYTLLSNYGLPSWCEEGYIIFSSSSRDKKLRLHFLDNEKKFIIYTGTGTDKIIAEYSSLETINDIDFQYFKYGSDQRIITKISYHS